MRQYFKGKGIKGVTLMQLTTSREPWNEGHHAKTHRCMGVFPAAVFLSLPLQHRWGSGMVQTRGGRQNGHG